MCSDSLLSTYIARNFRSTVHVFLATRKLKVPGKPWGARCSAVAGVFVPLGTVTSTFSSGLCSGAVTVPSCALTAPSLGSAAVATSASLTVRTLAFAASFSALCIGSLGHLAMYLHNNVNRERDV